MPTESAGVGAGPQIGLYPVGNAGVAGLFAAVFTHGVIAQNAQASDRQRAQSAADAVLEPYISSLTAWTSGVLWASTTSLLTSRTGIRHDAGGDATVHASPTFSLALDETFLILDAQIKIVKNNKVTEELVRVVSSPLVAPNAREYWAANDASNLKSTAAAMFAQAIIYVNQLNANADSDLNPMKTQRYLLGANERVERSRRVSSECGRLLLRTLRGTLMSVPVAIESTENCQRQSSF